MLLQLTDLAVNWTT